MFRVNLVAGLSRVQGVSNYVLISYFCYSTIILLLFYTIVLFIQLSVLAVITENFAAITETELLNSNKCI